MEVIDLAQRSTVRKPSSAVSRTGTRPVRKIPAGLRKRPPAYKSESRLIRRFYLRLRNDSQYLRTVVQLLFALLCVWIGIEFHLFVQWGQSGGRESFVSRPPGLEGFLPISGLISLDYWLRTGIINTIHPAALFILLAVVLLSIAAKKAFCGWLCPVGTLSESLWQLGAKLFGRNLELPRWLDYPLRSLKYLLLVFFGYSIWAMDVPALANFINSPYNKVADVKMYLFFAGISSLALWVITALIVLSVFIRNFWCRYLCPYGALLGIVGWLSPLKVTRTPSTCTDCGLCTKACPAEIAVHRVSRVRSDECTSCLACVQACPVADTLEVRTHSRGARIPGWAVGCLVVALFMAVTGLAMVSGRWQNTIPPKEYLQRFQNIESPVYQHFRGHVPHYGPDD